MTGWPLPIMLLANGLTRVHNLMTFHNPRLLASNGQMLVSKRQDSKVQQRLTGGPSGQRATTKVAYRPE